MNLHPMIGKAGFGGLNFPCLRCGVIDFNDRAWNALCHAEAE